MTPRSVIIVGVLIVIDQVAKFLISANIRLYESFPILKGAFHITRVHNTGAAFGLFKGMLPIFIFLSIITIFLIILYPVRNIRNTEQKNKISNGVYANRFRHSYSYLKIGLLLILAGTIGNLIDRLRFGYVIDFIDLRIWPVFNIADMTITIGGAFLVYHIAVMAQKKKVASSK